MQVAPTLVPLLKFYFHEDIRRAAVSGGCLTLKFFWVLCSVMYIFLNCLDAIFVLYVAMPELLRSAKLAVEKGQSQGRNESYIKQLLDYVIPALVEALRKVTLFYHDFLRSLVFYLSNFLLIKNKLLSLWY